MKNFFKDYLSTILEILAVISSGITFYILSDEGARALISFFMPKLSEKDLLVKIRSFQENSFWILVTIWIVFTIITIIVRVKSQKRISTLEETIKTKDKIIEEQKEELEKYTLLRQNISLIFEHHLRSIAQSLNFTNNERISLYIVDNNRFICCSRFSKNPTYKRWGRASYPLDEGVIGRAWNNGSEFFASLPDAQKDFKSYVERTKKKYGIPEDTIRGFSMFSKLLMGYRISNHDSSEHNAIIIVESTTKNFASKESILTVMMRNRECLYSLIKDFREFIPALARAEEEDM